MRVFLQSVVGLTSLMFLSVTDAAFAQGGGGRGMTERFQTLDADENGQVSASEAAEWQDAVFLAMDADDDGKLTREEYMAVQLGRGADPDQRGSRYEERQVEKDARFTQMDADADGLVTRDQFLSDGQDRFLAADADQNGVVSMSEFVSAHR